MTFSTILATAERGGGLTLETFYATLTLEDYNTRIVVVGATLLGMAAGVIGVFAYLRKRAMLGDALSHATLPGIALCFMLTGQKNLGFLLVGAAVSGILGVLAVMAMRYVPRIKEDAAIGVVLSVFFGAGMVLFSIIQQMGTGHEAGLQSFIYGKAAAMVRRDAMLIAISAGVVILGSLLLYKEFRMVCFDTAYASAQGWPVFFIDLIMMSLVVLTTVVGLQAVGLILIVALLIIPAAAARFWTDSLRTMVILAGTFGALCGWLGSTVSALAPRLPTGAIIVICTGILFLLSMFLAPLRGLIPNIWRRWTMRQRIALHHMLRALAEFEEQGGENINVSFQALFRCRSWSSARLRKLIRYAKRRDWLDPALLPELSLTALGRTQARRILRNHRLWEMYLIKYADIAPSHVDRDADEVEHVLSEEVVRELDEALSQKTKIPPSPHPLEVSP